MSQCLTCGQTGRIPPARLHGPVHFTGGCITSPACVTAFRWCPCWILPPYPSDKPTFLRSEYLLQGKALLMPNNTVYLSHFNAASKFGTHSLSSIKALIHLDYGSFSSARSSLSPAPDFVLRLGSNLIAPHADFTWKLKVVSTVTSSHSVLFSSFT